MATIVTPTTMTASVNSLNSTQKTDLQTALGIGSNGGGTGPGGSALSDVFFTQITSMRTIDQSMVASSGNSPTSTRLRWDSPTTTSTTGFGGFTDSTNTTFRFNRTVIATVGVGIGGYVSMNAPYAYGMAKGNAALRLYLGNVGQYGSVYTWNPAYQMFITEMAATIVKVFNAGDEVSVRLEAYAEGNSVNASLSAYGASPAGGASYFYVAI